MMVNLPAADNEKRDCVRELFDQEALRPRIPKRGRQRSISITVSRNAL